MGFTAGGEVVGGLGKHIHPGPQFKGQLASQEGVTCRATILELKSSYTIAFHSAPSANVS